MKAGLLDRIQAVGHWRVTLRPSVPLEKRLTLAECFDIVDRDRVSIRGWDFPHVSRREDEQGGTERVGEYVENWCDWHTQLEFWRMYKSGQFLFYSVLNDDAQQPLGQQAKLLDVIDAIYTVTEFVEFAARMNKNLYARGADLSVTLSGSEDRLLYAGRNRVPFFERRSTKAPSIVLDAEGLTIEPGEGAMLKAQQLLLELFDQFGWNPDAAQIRSTQEAFYRREWR